MIPSISSKRKAFIAISLASILYAFLPILIRISESYVSANSVVFNRFWIATILLGLFKVLRDRYRSLSTSRFNDSTSTQENVPNAALLSSEQSLPNTIALVPTLLWVAFPFFGTQMFWTWSIIQTTVANSEILHSLSPPIAVLAGWILFSQTFGRRFITGVAVSLLGTIAIFAGETSGVGNVQGDLLALVSALFYAAYLMAAEKLREQWGAVETALWGFSSAALLGLPVVLIMGNDVFPSSWQGWLSLLLYSLAGSMTVLLLNYALKSLSSALAATILLISPCLTAILGWLFFSESLSWLNICGFVLVLVGIYFSASDENDEEAESSLQPAGSSES